MSKFQKALDRLEKIPKDFTWQELRTIMSHFGYEELKGGGSARNFFHSITKASVHLHEPHPAPILKKYALKIIIDHLSKEKLL